MVKTLAKFVIALNGNVKRSQIAAGFAWGALLGVLPSGNAVWFALFVLSFFLRHNQGSKVIFMAVLKLVMPALYPAVDGLGWYILNHASLYPFWTRLYNTPFVPFTKFNNTLVAGGLASGIASVSPVFLAVYFLVPVYRNSVLPAILASKFWKTLIGALMKVPFVEKTARAVISISGFNRPDVI
jgi:uncharacterized protein (TIGR03546 family)